MLIFSSRQRLHLLLKLLRVVDFLIKSHLINGVRLLSFNLQNHLERAVWLLKEGLEKECLCFQFPTEIPKYMFMSFLFLHNGFVYQYIIFRLNFCYGCTNNLYKIKMSYHIHFYSHHNSNIKGGVIIGFYLRLPRICSLKYLNDEFNHIENSFLNLLYPKSFIHFVKSKALKIHNKNQPQTNANSPSYKTSPITYPLLCLTILQPTS